ncbi:MAG: acyl-CoA-binding protein [Bacteroidia bacterium]|nr:acyl-CoA-binding protein [Bacteroidia bacterium]
MTLEEKFESAKERILTLKEKPSNDTMLKVYSLYKQGSLGDIDMEAPGVFDFVAKAKYNAWEQLKGLSQDDAKMQYIDLVDELLSAAKKNPE